MKVLFATSEAVPLAKTGGLADVAGALPKALLAEGVDARVILPKYETIPAEHLQHFETVDVFSVQLGWRMQYCGLLKGKVDGVIYYLIDNEYYFRRGGLYGYDDDPERFVFFSIAVLEAARRMEDIWDVIHCHDWQTGLIPFLLKRRYWSDDRLSGVRTVFTIHNLKYQGVFGKQQMMDLVGMGPDIFGWDGLEHNDAANCMKGGLLYADKLTTVSPSYADEIKTAFYGEGMDGILRLRSGDLSGIVNGIDTELFDPMNDAAIDTPYLDSLPRKRRNKLALQKEMGLPQNPNVPVIGIVSRLVEQKGFDLIDGVLGELLEEDVQFAVLGSGDYKYEEMFRSAAYTRFDKVSIRTGFNDGLARRIYAGSDMYLMPSQFEPCGLSQLLALRYRTVPIVRETGGLRDTVRPFNEYTGEGNGFSFANYNAHDLLHTIRRAIGFYRKEKVWKEIVHNGTLDDYSWSRSAGAYIGLYEQLAPERKEKETWPVTS
ncbi:glycogen synthase GlgA [Paenibacillus pasadenensis]|uniref:glycogen synthase GlgA n=1 Tax=Paenibacillus pasadenensis TaxID=217090 RepID=UPI00203A3C89|nr:glycogen synthase GlgA [Paenibacillus pasadenensis]MCM3747262.1 glycogen synthase GlgA [Paenibacillus pasadenensis]